MNQTWLRTLTGCAPGFKGGSPPSPYRKESIPQLPPFVKEGRGGFYNHILNKLQDETARLLGRLITSLSGLKKGV
jgi:hypothetical protein